MLNDYFPPALEWAGTERASPLAGAFLQRWPSLALLPRARPATVARFYPSRGCRHAALLAQQLAALAPSLAQLDADIAQRVAAHADADSFRSLPGAGAACAPRLLAAFGSDRRRFPAAAAAMQPRAVIAPITVRSGQQEQVRWRWCTNTVRRQTFHEFAGHSVRHCLWAKRFYHRQRTRGTSHHAALRALAFKWIRILWRCWHDHTVYDDARYTSALTLRGAPLTSALRARIHEASPCLA